MPLLITAIRTELRKLEKAVSEADFRLPDAVRTSRDDWQLTLVQQGSEHPVKIKEIDLDRLAWFKASKDFIDEIVAKCLSHMSTYRLANYNARTVQSDQEPGCERTKEFDLLKGHVRFQLKNIMSENEYQITHRTLSFGWIANL